MKIFGRILLGLLMVVAALAIFLVASVAVDAMTGGNRVAEMQLTIIWEEILKRFPEIKVVGEPVLNWSAFVHGFESLPVIIPYRT